MRDDPADRDPDRNPVFSLKRAERCIALLQYRTYKCMLGASNLKTGADEGEKATGHVIAPAHYQP